MEDGGWNRGTSNIPPRKLHARTGCRPTTIITASWQHPQPQTPKLRTTPTFDNQEGACLQVNLQLRKITTSSADYLIKGGTPPQTSIFLGFFFKFSSGFY